MKKHYHTNYRPKEGDRYICITRLEAKERIAFNGREFICTGRSGNCICGVDGAGLWEHDCKKFRFRKVSKSK